MNIEEVEKIGIELEQGKKDLEAFSIAYYKEFGTIPPVIVNKELSRKIILSKQVQAFKQYYPAFIFWDMIGLALIYIGIPYVWYKYGFFMSILSGIAGGIVKNANDKSACQWVVEECKKNIDLFLELYAHGVIKLNRETISKTLKNKN